MRTTGRDRASFRTGVFRVWTLSSKWTALSNAHRWKSQWCSDQDESPPSPPWELSANRDPKKTAMTAALYQCDPGGAGDKGVGRGETFIIASSLTQIAICMSVSALKKLNKLYTYNLW